MMDRREHLERLFAEAADGPMSPEEQSRCAKLARLLAGWRQLDAAVDSAALSSAISSRVRDEIEAQASARVDSLIDPTIAGEPAVFGIEPAVRDYRAVDDLLQGSAAPLPPVNWDALSARISAAVQREARAVTGRKGIQHRLETGATRRKLAWLAGIVVPLAAAAVIALVVWSARPSAQIAKAPEKQPKSSVFVSVETPDASGKVNVTFDEAKPKNALSDELTPEGSGIAHGPPNIPTKDAPIDPAMLP